MNSSQKSPNRNILIVDDEEDVLELLGIYLESQQWNVTAVNSPARAFQQLEQTPFFLVMTDIAMPNIDGYEFISALQEKKVASQIAFMTGFGYNPQHTLVKINKKYHYPIFFKPFELKKPKLREMVQHAWEEYHRDLT